MAFWCIDSMFLYRVFTERKFMSIDTMLCIIYNYKQQGMSSVGDSAYSAENGWINQECTDTEKSVCGNCFREGGYRPCCIVKEINGINFRFHRQPRYCLSRYWWHRRKATSSCRFWSVSKGLWARIWHQCVKKKKQNKNEICKRQWRQITRIIYVAETERILS